MQRKLKTCQRGGISHAGEGTARKVTLAPTRIGVCSSGLFQFALGSFGYGESFHESAAKMSTRPLRRWPLFGSRCTSVSETRDAGSAFPGRTTAPAAEERDVRLDRIAPPDS